MLHKNNKISGKRVEDHNVTGLDPAVSGEIKSRKAMLSG